MKVDGVPYRTIWLAEDGWSVHVIDQTRLPHELVIARLTTVAEAAHAIRAMLVRGAPLIGATAAYGLCLGLRADPSDEAMDRAYETLAETRPTAVNLKWALDDLRARLRNRPRAERAATAYARAREICDEDVATNQAIGGHGLKIIEQAWTDAGKDRAVNVLTHCNAGWLATVDWGTALAPVYLAHDRGIPVHVWATRPGRAIRVRRSPPGSWAVTGFPTPWWWTAPAAISCSGGWWISASPAPTAPPRQATSATRSAPISWPSRPATTA